MRSDQRYSATCRHDHVFNCNIGLAAFLIATGLILIDAGGIDLLAPAVLWTAVIAFTDILNIFCSSEVFQNETNEKGLPKQLPVGEA